MSGPFIYTPAASIYDFGPSPYLQQFYNRQRISPLIPVINLYDSSAPSTPIRDPSILTEDPWASSYTRARRPYRWHAGMDTPFPNASLNVPDDHTHTRPSSFDNRSQKPNVSDYFKSEPSSPYPWAITGTPKPYTAASDSSTYAYTGNPPVIPSELHPLLRPNSGAIRFDLSNFEFRPLDAQGAPIPSHILTQPATHPPTTRLAIKSDGVPQWPILLDHQSATAGASHSPSELPHITLYDVLYAIHQTMQTQILRMEWEELEERERIVITKAYVRRSKLVPRYEKRIAAEGVRRVDYLLKNVMFNGLTRKNGDQGYENLKLVVQGR